MESTQGGNPKSQSIKKLLLVSPQLLNIEPMFLIRYEKRGCRVIQFIIIFFKKKRQEEFMPQAYVLNGPITKALTCDQKIIILKRVADKLHVNVVVP